jgi:hypothetical protein
MCPMSPRLLRPRASGLVATDPDARTYISAVQIADASSLEPAVQRAIDDFVKGCKADGIWSAIKASCILMGARTLSGALVPLVGSAPTNNGPFVSGDYNRKTGLVGNASTKHLNTNRTIAADPSANHHLSVFTTVADSQDATLFYIGAVTVDFAGHFIGVNSAEHFYRSSASAGTQGPAQSSVGFFGVSRNSSTVFNFLGAGTSGSLSTNSNPSLNAENMHLFARTRAGTLENFSNARIAFYSIGESLTLSLLDTRVTNLYTAIGAAIP